MSRFVVHVVGCFALCGLQGCQKQSKAEEPPRPFDAQAVMIETMQSLEAKVRVFDGSLYIEDDLGTVHAYPRPPSWKLSCGLLGTRLVVRGSTASDDEISVRLSGDTLASAQCAQVLPRTMDAAKARLTRTAP